MATSARDSVLGSVPRASGMVARAACAEARRAGIDVGPLLARANLTAAQINDPRATLVASDQVRLLELVADALGDDLLGFRTGGRVELREAGLFYYVMASSQTVLEAMRRSVRYSSIANEGLLHQCAFGRTLDLTLHYVGSRRQADRHHTECWAVLVVRLLRELANARISPVRVRFVHRRPACPADFAAFFGGKVEFGARTDDIRFERAVGERPVASADPYLNKVLVGYCEEALAHRRAVRGSFRALVENAIVPLLPHGEASAAAVARRIGVSERTFSRRLAAEGLTFSALLERMRLDLANRYLADTETSISEIAWLLGYREVSSLSKAFKRWTGRSPREARAAGMG